MLFHEMFPRLRPDRLAGLLLVVGAHAVALWSLWHHRLLPVSQEAMALFVEFIAPPVPVKKEEPQRPPPPRPKPIENLQPRHIVAETHVVAPTDYVAPAPPTQPVPQPSVEAPAMPLPTGPVVLSSELAMACPERIAPTYPPQARRLGQEGTVVLRVELDESGRVLAARVASSCGHAKLDEAALGAVRTWRCTPAQRNGQPVRAVALQPFKFVLQEN